uniref:Glutathione S-transferase n=1 Tax=Mus spicilegus TaxID=10103 RepID=A0A8C6HJP5_MUSSI
MKSSSKGPTISNLCDLLFQLTHSIRLLLEYTDSSYEEKRYVMGDAPNFDRSQWLSEKFNLGLDFPNVSAGKGRFGEDMVISPHLLAWLKVGDQCFCSPAPSLLAAQCFCDGLCPSSLIQCTLCPWRASHGRHTECQALCLLSPREGMEGPHIPSDLPCLSIQLPYLIDGSHKVTQSNAILRYLGRKHNLCGETEEERIRVDILEKQVMDTRIQMGMLCYSADFEKRKPEFLKGLPDQLKLYSEFLGKQPWFAGNKITFADFLVYDVLDQHRMFEPKCLDAFPNLKDFVARFEGLRKISAYMKTSRFLPSPVYLKQATWGNE